MAYIKKKTDDVYEVTISLGYDNGIRQRKSKSFVRPSNMPKKKWEKEIKKLAIIFEKEANEAHLSKDTVDSNMSLNRFVNFWYDNYGKINLEQSTIESYEIHLRTKILPNLGNVRLKDLTSLTIMQFLNGLVGEVVRNDGEKSTYSDRTIRYQWQILSSLLKQAVYWQILDENPCKNVRVPKNKSISKDDPIKFYTETEAVILLQLLQDEVNEYRQMVDGNKDSTLRANPLKYQVAINIALFCALRKGELLGLTWDDIDFEKKSLSVNKARVFTNKDKMLTKAPKNKSSARCVSIPDTVISLLRCYKEEQEQEIKKLGELRDQEWFETPWLFTKWNGNGMDGGTLTKYLKKLVSRYNDRIPKSLPASERKSLQLPILGMHGLRHTSATLLIRQNVDIKTVAYRLGHASIDTTMIYVHALKSIDRLASDKLEKLIGNNKDEQ